MVWLHCAGCQRLLGPEFFSESQWRTPTGVSRCYSCVNSTDSSDTKMNTVRKNNSTTSRTYRPYDLDCPVVESGFRRVAEGKYAKVARVGEASDCKRYKSSEVYKNTSFDVDNQATDEALDLITRNACQYIDKAVAINIPEVSTFASTSSYSHAGTEVSQEPFVENEVCGGILNGTTGMEKTLTNVKKSLSKPRRPLSAYNIFFRHERDKIVSGTPDTPVTLESIEIHSKRHSKKRRHRKSHGKIGFADLARTIADKWKSLDSNSRAVFEECAAKEKLCYKKATKEWEKSKKNVAIHQEEEVAKTQAGERAARILRANQAAQNNNVMTGNVMTSANMGDTGGDYARMLEAMRYSQTPWDVSNDYLQPTRQVLGMAQASLSLPLLGNLQQKNGMVGTQPSALMDVLRMNENGNQPATFMDTLRMSRMSDNKASSILRSNNGLELLELSNGPLLNVPFGSNGSYLLDSELHHHQQMQSQEIALLSVQNQLLQELEYNQAHSNLAPSSHRGDLDSALQYSLNFGSNCPEHGYNGLWASASQNNDTDEFFTMVNAPFRDMF